MYDNRKYNVNSFIGIVVLITVCDIYISFTFMHLADAFIQSDLQCIQAIHVLSVCVFPGNRTHNLLRC